MTVAAESLTVRSSNPPAQARTNGLLPAKGCVSRGCESSAAAPSRSSSMLPLEAILSLIPQPAMIVDGKSWVQATNSSFSRWLAYQKTLDVSLGRMSWRNARHHVAFSALLKQMIDDSEVALGHRRTRLSLSGPERTLPLIIDCLSVLTVEATRDGSTQRHALIVLHDLQDSPPIDLHILIDVFGLTRTEARVAGLLAEGQAPTDIGLIFDRSMGTIRSHLRVIADKLGVHRQSEVVRLLTRLPQAEASDSRTGTRFG